MRSNCCKAVVSWRVEGLTQIRSNETVSDLDSLILVTAALLIAFESRQGMGQEQGPGRRFAAKPNFSLWSAERIKDYRQTLKVQLAPAVALLRIPKIQLEVPVLEGTDDVSLNRAVGLIAGTARPGEDGNIGIAGHRDGFFRGLKDIQEGDGIELVTATGTDTYTIDRIAVVTPDDASVLARRQGPSITLVTCYPFYFVGSAPQRYIVQASMKLRKSHPAEQMKAQGKSMVRPETRE